MWIHANVTQQQLESIASLSGAVPLCGLLDLEIANSRTHNAKYRVHLFGKGDNAEDGTRRRRTNSGNRGAGAYLAATYDEWGQFLAAVFEIDPTAKCEYYSDRDDFHAKTEGKYLPA